MGLLDVDDRTDRNSNMLLGEDVITKKNSISFELNPKGECSVFSATIFNSRVHGMFFALASRTFGVDHDRS